MNAIVSNMGLVLAFTKVQLGITIAIAVVLAGLIASNFIVLYMISKKRRAALEGEVDSLREHSENLKSQLNETQEASRELRVHLTQSREAGETLKARLDETVRMSLSGKSRLLIRAKEDDDDDENIMHYNRSFRARLIQAPDDLKEWYSDVKNAILAHKDIKSKVSWKWESFRWRRRTLVKLMIRGKSLCVYMAQESLDVDNVKLRLEDASGMASMKDTPILARIKNDKTLRAVIFMLNGTMEKFALEKTDREPVDYYQAYCGTVALIKKGLIKRVVRDATKMPGRKAAVSANPEPPQPADAGGADPEAARAEPETGEEVAATTPEPPVKEEAKAE